MKIISHQLLLLNQVKLLTIINTWTCNGVYKYKYYNIDLKRKLSAADRLNESILATTRLGDIAEKKFQMKAAYYEKKIKLMEENNQLLKNLGTAINSLTKNF